MSKKINNQNINKDDLLKRAKSGDSEGLDDFEKEAFDGFASLENNELAEKLTAELDKRIDAKYGSEKEEAGKVVAFTPKEEPSKFRYYAMAAGLLLVIGLTVVFFNDFTSKEESLAYQPETTEAAQDKVNKSLENEVATGSGEATSIKSEVTGVKSAEAIEAEPKTDPASQAPPAPPAEKVLTDGIRDQEEKIANRKEAKPSDDGDANGKAGEMSPRMVVKGPATKSAPVVTEEQKNQPDLAAKDAYGGVTADKEVTKAEGKERAKESDDRNSDYKTTEALGKKQDVAKAKKANEPRREDNLAQASAPAGNVETVSKGSVAVNNPKQEKAALDEMEVKKHDEGAMPRTTSSTNAAGSGVTGNDNVSLRRSSFFKTAKFNNHVDYLKTEIDKNETLKTNLAAYGKSFRIDLIVTEKGRVSEAKANLTQGQCADCKEQIEKILNNMPNWEPAQNSNGTPVKQTFYFNYKYQ